MFLFVCCFASDVKAVDVTVYKPAIPTHLPSPGDTVSVSAEFTNIVIGPNQRFVYGVTIQPPGSGYVTNATLGGDRVGPFSGDIFDTFNFNIQAGACNTGSISFEGVGWWRILTCDPFSGACAINNSGQGSGSATTLSDGIGATVTIRTGPSANVQLSWTDSKGSFSPSQLSNSSGNATFNNINCNPSGSGSVRVSINGGAVVKNISAFTDVDGNGLEDVCNGSSTTVTIPLPGPGPSAPPPASSGPAPSSAPGAPSLTNFSCVGSNSATLSWSGTALPSSDPGCPNGFWVDISTDNGFPSGGYYHKCVNGTSTDAPGGFSHISNGSPLSISPGTTYYARVFNGSHSNVASVSCGSVPPPSSAPAPEGPPLMSCSLPIVNETSGASVAHNDSSTADNITINANPGDVLRLPLTFKNLSSLKPPDSHRHISNVNLIFNLPPQVTYIDSSFGCPLGGSEVRCQDLYPIGTPIMPGNQDSRYVRVRVNPGATSFTIPAARVEFGINNDPHFPETGRVPSNQWGRNFAPDAPPQVNGYNQYYRFSCNTVGVSVAGATPPPAPSPSPAANCPTVPQNLAPSGTIMSCSNTITLTWKNDPNAKSYNVRADDGINDVKDPANNVPGCPHAVCINGLPAGTTSITVRIVPGRSYGWWIEAVGDPIACPAPTVASTNFTTVCSGPGSISGNVWIDCDMDRVRDTGEALYSGSATVCLDPTSTGDCTGKPQRTVSGGAYNFASGSFPGGSHTVYLQTPTGYTPTTNTSVVANSGAGGYNPSIINYGLHSPSLCTAASPSPGGGGPAPSPSSVPSDTCLPPEAGYRCTTGSIPSGCSTTGITGAQHAWCANLVGSAASICIKCTNPTPPPPPMCNAQPPVNNKPTITLLPDGVTLQIQYRYPWAGAQNPPIGGEIVRSTARGFATTGGTEIGTQFGNHGISFDYNLTDSITRTYYYQAKSIAGSSTAFSNTYALSVPPQKDNDGCDLSPFDYYNPGTIKSIQGIDSSSSEFTFELTYEVRNGNPFADGCIGPCTMKYAPTHLILTPSGGGKPGYVPWQTGTGTCVETFNGRCRRAEWKAEYTIGLPPDTVQDYSVASFATSGCNYQNLAGNANITAVTPLGNASPTEVDLSATRSTMNDGRNRVNVVMSPADGNQVKVYRNNTRWSGASLPTTRVYSTTSGPYGEWIFTATDNISNLTEKTYYYGVHLDLYPIVGYCEARDVYTDQASFNTPAQPWIRTRGGGDVHSNTRIVTPGGPQ